MSQDWVSAIITMSISLLSALVALIITIFKTKKTQIEKKVDKVINDVSNANMKKYYIVIDGKKYFLSDVVIYKDDGTEVDNEKKN